MTPSPQFKILHIKNLVDDPGRGTPNPTSWSTLIQFLDQVHTSNEKKEESNKVYVPIAVDIETSCEGSTTKVHVISIAVTINDADQVFLIMPDKTASSFLNSQRFQSPYIIDALFYVLKHHAVILTGRNVLNFDIKHINENFYGTQAQVLGITEKTTKIAPLENLWRKLFQLIGEPPNLNDMCVRLLGYELPKEIRDTLGKDPHKYTPDQKKKKYCA